MIGSNLTLDLDAVGDDLLEGPLLLRSGDVEVFRAKIKLRATPERFSLFFDAQNLASSGASLGNFMVDITGKKSLIAPNIQTPSSTLSLQSILDEIESLPVDQAFQEISPDAALSLSGALPQ